MAVNQKRVDEVVEIQTERVRRILGEGMDALREAIRDPLVSSPEFQTPEWIRCSERMPEYGPVYFAVKGPQDSTVFAGSVCQIYWRSERGSAAYQRSDKSITHWMPRRVPAPPVKDLRSVFSDDSREWEMDRGGLTIKHAREVTILIVKRHEQKAKK